MQDEGVITSKECFFLTLDHHLKDEDKPMTSFTSFFCSLIQKIKTKYLCINKPLVFHKEKTVIYLCKECNNSIGQILNELSTI